MASTYSRSIVRATGLMLLWWIVVYGAGSTSALRLQPAWFPHLGVVVTNMLGVAALAIAGWRLHLLAPACGEGWGLRRAGLALGDWRRAVWPAPFLACFVGYPFLGRDGIPWLEGSAGVLLSSAVGMLAVGLSEEFGSRGLPLARWTT